MCWKSNSYYPSTTDPYFVPGKPIRIFCTSCGKEVPENNHFCGNCGETVVKIRPKNTNQCACGALFTEKEKFCYSCGKKR